MTAGFVMHSERGIFRLTQPARCMPAAALSVLPGARVCVVFYGQMSELAEKAVFELKGPNRTLAVPHIATSKMSALL
jgi:hypothetical protein